MIVMPLPQSSPCRPPIKIYASSSTVRFSLFLVLVIAGCCSAFAHPLKPAFLEITQQTEDSFGLLWKVPAQNQNEPVPLALVLPDNVVYLNRGTPEYMDGAWLQRSRLRNTSRLYDLIIEVRGLPANLNTLVRISYLDGEVRTHRLTRAEPRYQVSPGSETLAVIQTYLLLGMEHILSGADHLLFVLALLLLVVGRKQLLITITTFTLAHSLALAVATLGYVSVPAAPVEALIALSIAFVAAEILYRRQGRAGLASRHPWQVAFLFGLLHGLGFASALNETGLPMDAIPLALLLFNIGVELGQIAFIGICILIAAVGRPIIKRAPEQSHILAPYLIGSVAMFWVIERVMTF